MEIHGVEKFINEDELIDINFNHLHYTHGIVEGKTFDSTILNHAIFEDVDFKNCSFDICFMEYSRFTNCRFIEVRMTHSILACSTFKNCLFEECDLISVNYNGIEAEETCWQSSDLYYSRFISSHLRNVLIHDCNLKRVDFSHMTQDNLSFKNSNVQDAYLGRKEGIS